MSKEEIPITLKLYSFKNKDAIMITPPNPTTNSLLSIRNSNIDKTKPTSTIWIPIKRNILLFIYCIY